MQVVAVAATILEALLHPPVTLSVVLSKHLLN
jgi:hypothetical protein